ncbi:7923_t:CDS:2 [Acaulospora morrowiae]|uniref:7923_t:CDS:1 n=1 Tax=Acaulospora morrowiae TaxID=94023 RepID=A0A9N9G511_9GLOM|nr:7923_t:CDS:2 [Acaulospora morrowiae]
MNSSQKPNVVILGGGYAGIAIATKLEAALHKTHQILLIERKTHFYHAVAGPRAVTIEGFEEKIMIPYDHMFKFDGKVIHAIATSIRQREITVSLDGDNNNQRNIPFEYLIIATGSSYPRPGKMEADNKFDAVKQIAEQRNAIKNAKRILIVGGGPVGIELAGEIASVYQNKQITLVHSEKSLLNSKYPQKMRDMLADQLKELKVNLVLGERVDLTSISTDGLTPVTLETNNNRVIESDIQFVTIGSKPNTEIIKTLDASLLELNTNLVKVKPTLELDNDNYDRIFAAGDITNIQETKMAYRAGLHAEIIVKNVLAKVNNNRLVDYKSPPELILVTVGKKKGAGLLPMFGGKVVGSFMIKGIKGKSLFIDKYWKSLNAKQEK